MTDETMVSPVLAENIKYCSVLLGNLLLQKPDSPDVQILLEELRQLESLDTWPFGDEEDIDDAFQNMKASLFPEIAKNDLLDDYQQLFIGPFSLKAPPWGSAYLDYEGVVFGSSTLSLRAWLRDNGITSAAADNEPEDHVGLLLLLLAWLADERPDLVVDFLAEHFLPWAPRFCELMATGAKTPFYQGLAALTTTTLEGMKSELGITPVSCNLYR